MNEMIRIHDCLTGQIVDRPRTPEEQAAVDAERIETRRRMAETELEICRRAAVRALDQQVLEAALADQNAPQAVKDYAALLASATAERA